MATKEKHFANEFSAKNKRLMADVRQVRRSIQMLSERKMNDVLILNTQLTLSHISGNIIVPYMENLSKTLRLEERYLKIIIRKLREFMHDVRKVEHDSRRITGRRIKQFIQLSGRYIVDLRLVLKDIVKLTIVVLRINYYQQKFMDKVEKSLAKHKVPRSFPAQFYKKNYDEEFEMKELMERLEKIRTDMDNVRNRLIDSFQASRGPLSKIGGLYITAGMILGLAEAQTIQDALTFGTTLFSSAAIHFRKDLKKGLQEFIPEFIKKRA